MQTLCLRFFFRKYIVGSTLSGRISDALTDGRWADALAALAEMRARGQVPKLGALQRWVRDCDAASLRDGSHADPQIFRVLDSILRTADPALVCSPTADYHPVRQNGSWSPFPRASPLEMVYDTIKAGKLFSECLFCYQRLCTVSFLDYLHLSRFS
jgi:hypothetical protein